MPADLPRLYLTYPKSLPRVSRTKRFWHILGGLVFFPLYWAMAYAMGVPGLVFRRQCAVLGVRLLLKGRDLRRAYNLVVAPMDSVRYFEFDFMWSTIRRLDIDSYLDVSSPRLFPLMVVDRVPGLIADLINPDRKDLAATISWAKSLNIADRCRVYPNRIEEAPVEIGSFDLITSISVVEHIPDDTAAIRKMWDLLRPGGLLLVTVPCAAMASEEYINVDEYELLEADERGFVFWQRYYDEELLDQRIFSVTGRPRRMRIYGEKCANSYNQNATRKRTDALYPYWREPFMMGLEYELKNRLSELPGMGVVAMEFVKPHWTQQPITTVKGFV